MTDKSSALDAYAAQEGDCKVLYVVMYREPRHAPEMQAAFRNALAAEAECERLIKVWNKPSKRFQIVAYVPKQFAKQEESENDD